MLTKENFEQDTHTAIIHFCTLSGQPTKGVSTYLKHKEPHAFSVYQDWCKAGMSEFTDCLITKSKDFSIINVPVSEREATRNITKIQCNYSLMETILDHKIEEVSVPYNSDTFDVATNLVSFLNSYPVKCKLYNFEG